MTPACDTRPHHADPRPTFVGKTVVVIGGSSGIGLEIVRQAQALGAAVTAVARDGPRLDAALSRFAGRVDGIVADAHAAGGVESLAKRLPVCDHIVSMIGDTMAGGFLDSSLDVMRHVVESKFWTNLAIARAVAPGIRDGGSLTFTSGTGVRPHQASGSFMANGALAAMVEGLAVELAARVRVNLVAPAFMDTALWRDRDRSEVEARIARYSEANPLGRPGRIEEVAQAYLYLMTNAYVTGQVLAVDGGMMLVT